MKSFVKKYKWYICMVILPFMITALYQFLLASPQYESSATFSIQQESSQSSDSSSNPLRSMMNQPSVNDTLLLQKFILSHDLLKKIDGSIKLRQHFQDDAYDWISRLSSNDKFEDFYSYFLGYAYYPGPGYSFNMGRIDVTSDPISGIMSLSVRAYDPEMAQRIAVEILSESARYVNEINREMARQQTAYFQSETEKAADRAQNSASILTALQDKYHIINPEAEITAQGQLIAGLEAEIASQKAELTRLRGYLSPKAPELIAQQNRVSALVQQAETQREKLAGRQQALNSLGLKYQKAQVAATLDAELYKATLSALQNSKMDSLRNLKYLAVISAPSLPEKSLYPRTGYILATLFILLNIVFGISSLIMATIKDHRD